MKSPRLLHHVGSGADPEASRISGTPRPQKFCGVNFLTSLGSSCPEARDALFRVSVNLNKISSQLF